MPEAQPDQVLEKVQKVVFKKRIRIQDNFRDYDGLRSFKVTKNRFGRALDLAKLGLSNEEVADLAEHYAVDDDYVHYGNFCADVNLVFTLPELEKNPTATVHAPGETLNLHFEPLDLGAEHEKELNEVMYKIALLVKTEGVVLKYQYCDFDRSNCGCVTETQFRRNFPFTNRLTEEQLNMVVARYSDRQPDGRVDVNYRVLHEDVSEFDTSHPSAPLGGAFYTGLKKPVINWSTEDMTTVQILQARANERGLRLRDYFQDHDPLRKGFCQVEKVRYVLTIMSVEVSNDKFDDLVMNYVAEDGLFNYEAFCAHLQDGSIQIPRDSAGSARDTVKLSGDEYKYIDDLEETMNAKVTHERIDFKPMFQDFDRCKTGHVTVSQFGRVMLTKGFNLEPIEVQMLAKRHCDKGNPRDINYNSFIRSVTNQRLHKREWIDEPQ